MIFTEQDLNIGANAYNIINESVSIESDKLISPNTISLIESGSIGGYVVRFNDVEELSEAYGIDYIDSMLAIAEVNGIDPQYLAVAVNEADIIMNPDLVYELANVVTVPISENSMAYQFCEACIDGYAYTGDESYIELLVEEEDYSKMSDEELEAAAKRHNSTVADTFRFRDKMYAGGHDADTNNKLGAKLRTGAAAKGEFDKIMKEWNARQERRKGTSMSTDSTPSANPAPAASGASTTAQQVDNKNQGEKNEGIIDRIKRTVGSAAHKSADWIAKKIASLRAMYKGWVTKVRLAKTQGKDKWYQSVGEKVLSAIDWALSKLQNLLKASDKSREKYGIDAWKGKAARVGDHQGYNDWKTANASRIEKYQNFANRHK